MENGLSNKEDNVFKGLANYYYTYVDKSNHTYISANYRNGLGKIYVKIVSSDDTTTPYPTKNKFDIVSQYIYLGQGLNINTNIMHQKCISTLCKLLITVTGEEAWSSDSMIHYKLSISSQDKKIYQNVPFRSWISKREMHYFTIYLSEPLKTITVSLTNLDGDADLLMNYGKDTYPTPFNSTWDSMTMQSEFIDLDLTDKFFAGKKLTSMSGWYTIGIVGVKNTSYTLHVGTHPNQVMHLNDYSPSSCKRTKSKGQEYCFFKYNDFNIRNKLQDFEMVISTEFLYGSGIIYASLADLEDFKDYDYFDNLPKANKYEFSSINGTNDELFIKIPTSDPRLTKSNKIDPILLISVHCLGDCFFSMTAASKLYHDLKYIDRNRDNLIFINKHSNITLMYYDHLFSNMDYKINLLKGKVKIDVISGKNKKEILLNDDKPGVSTRYHTKINNNSTRRASMLYNQIETFDQDVVFYINISYDEQWNKLQLGARAFRYLIDEQTSEFLGYFHMLQNYESVLLSAKALNINKATTSIKLYAKYLMLDKLNKMDEVIETTYTIPGETNSEIIQQFDNILNTVILFNFIFINISFLLEFQEFQTISNVKSIMFLS